MNSSLINCFVTKHKLHNKTVVTSLLDAVLVVGVVGVARAEEVELGVVDLVLLDPLLELGAVPRHEARGLVHDVPDLEKWPVTFDVRIGFERGLRGFCFVFLGSNFADIIFERPLHCMKT